MEKENFIISKYLKNTYYYTDWLKLVT